MGDRGHFFQMSIHPAGACGQLRLSTQMFTQATQTACELALLMISHLDEDQRVEMHTSLNMHFS